MADHSRDRVEAAARAQFDATNAELNPGLQWRGSDEHPYWMHFGRVSLAAADDCDRMAGVVRVDTSMVEERVLHAITGAIRTEDMTYAEAENTALEVLSALAALGAVGVGEQQGGQT